MKAIKNRVKQNIQHIYEEDDSPEVMKNLGIDTIVGSAKFIEDNVIEVTRKSTDDGKGDCITVNAKDGVLICTGASPKVPGIAGLNSIEYLTYEHAFDVEEVPNSLTVVGGGPIGVELAQSYSRLGAKVTIIAERLLPREEPEAGEALRRVFEKEGIRIVSSRLSSVQATGKGIDKESSHIATCQNGEAVNGDSMLIAMGRAPVVEGMNLSEMGVELNKLGGIKVDKKLATTAKGIYAAGDCTGYQQYTHYAGYQGAVGARNILLPLSDPGLMKFVPGTTFTDPQVASVGMTEADAVDEYGNGKIAVAFKAIKETDRGICDNVDEGYIKIVYLKRGYKILGACIMSPVAGESIAEISVAMKAGMSFDQLATVIHTYPSHSFAIQAMAAELYYDKLVKLKPILNLLKWFGL